MDANKVADTIRRLEDNIERVFIGKKETLRMTSIAFFSEGHLLLDDAPGVGKTLLGRALAKSLDATFSRIQFTSDLLPSDAIGGEIFSPKTQEFTFSPGPIFANTVLADEVNRAPARTQSAMLEAMSEGCVTSGGQTYPLPRPFFVIATENPVEFEGVYPLPESQLDRFLMRISIGYPDRAAELAILDAHKSAGAVDALKPVLTLEEAREVQRAAIDVAIERSVAEYMLDVVEATRKAPEIAVGASPRASLAFARALRVCALTEGRDYVVPDDVKRLAVPVLAHRLSLKERRRSDARRRAEEAVARALATVAAPR